MAILYGKYVIPFLSYPEKLVIQEVGFTKKTLECLKLKQALLKSKGQSLLDRELILLRVAEVVSQDINETLKNLTVKKIVNSKNSAPDKRSCLFSFSDLHPQLTLDFVHRIGDGFSASFTTKRIARYGELDF